MSSNLLFHYSAVREVSPFSVTEINETLPLDIYPFFMASQVLAYGVDGTGMQGLDSRACEHPPYHSQYGSFSYMDDDLYMWHSGMKSTHNRLQMLRMPMGWIDYLLVIDGEEFNAEAIAENATQWKRHFDLRRGVLTINYRLKNVDVEIGAYVAKGSVIPVYQFKFSSVDGGTHDIILRSSVHLTMRSGETLFPHLPQAWVEDDMTGFTLNVSSDDNVKLLEPYTITFGIQGGAPNRIKNGLEIEKSLQASGKESASCSVVFYFGSNQTGTSGDDLCRKGLREPLSLRDHVEHMELYWKTHASVSTGDQRRDYLYHFCLWLCDFGTDMRFGAQCCGNFVPLHLGDMVFWDSHYITDGLLHAGELEAGETFVMWLKKVMGRDGKRPFWWMVHYNGQADQDDTAYTSLCAHAMSAIKVAMFSNKKDIFEACNEIVQNVAKYAVTNFFEKTDKGWILSAPSTTDITFSSEFTDKAKNNTFTHCWFLSILLKALEFGQRSGKSYDHLMACSEIINHFYLEQNDREYLDQKDGRTGGRYDSYIPVLCYPTEGHHWVDGDKYRHTRMLHEIYTNNMAVRNMKMPWPMLWGAASDLRVGLSDAAEARISNALMYVYGPGYFAESYSEGQVSVSEPYLTTCGTFLTVQSEQFFYVDFFENKMRLFSNCGRMQELTKISFERLRGYGGLRANGTYTPDSLEVVLEGGSGQVFEIDVFVPYKLRGLNVVVKINGNIHSFEREPVEYETFIDCEDHWRTVSLASKTIKIKDVAIIGTTVIEVSEGRPEIESVKAEQIFIYDFCGLGTQLGGILQKNQMEVCRTSSIRAFLKKMKEADYCIFTDTEAQLSPEQANELEIAVRQGASMIFFFEQGLTTNKEMSAMLGLSLSHAAGHRWNMTLRDVKLLRGPSAPGDLVDGITFKDVVQLEGTVQSDVKVLYTDEEGNPYCTFRKLGKGRVLWIASGQLHLAKREFLQSKEWQDWFVKIVRFWKEF
ncbi:MAG: hypothetical protein SGI71_11815 [Verrucomicrobiota bacterium]|nr:hypothetical protein [Verrucomicrobiota bacterium]